jgi:hypothetical protein
MDDPFGDYTYHALQAQVTKRISSGLTVLASYSWSKNITNADSEYPTEAAWEGNDTSGALNTYNLKVEKALSQFDIRSASSWLGLTICPSERAKSSPVRADPSMCWPGDGRLPPSRSTKAAPHSP